MLKIHRHAVSALAVSALLSGLIVVSPLYAATPATTASPMQSVPSSPQAEAAKAAKHSAKVEAHITDLKKTLKITDAQTAQWDAFAQVMRDNGDAMESGLQARDMTKGMSAVDDLQSYAKITQVHADGAQKLVPAFQALYDTMTPEQKKNADAVFEQTHSVDGAKKK